MQNWHNLLWVSMVVFTVKTYKSQIFIILFRVESGIPTKWLFFFYSLKFKIPTSYVPLLYKYTFFIFIYYLR